MSMGLGNSSPTVHRPFMSGSCLPTKQKGQLRNAKPKPSGAAQLKRNAKKRKNINSRKGK